MHTVSIIGTLRGKMGTMTITSQAMAAAITRVASKQTYYTIHFFVDRGLVDDAYRAYGYFRWLDDILDEGTRPGCERLEFALGQKSLLEACYRGEIPGSLRAEEMMLVDLVRNDTEENSGLQSYLRNMMDVMIFDARRRGQLVSQDELAEYSRKLSTAVTEAIHYFIDHDQPAPFDETRYLAVTAAHIVHMLRDAVEDAKAGYFNIPSELLRKHGIAPGDIKGLAYQEWVCKRIHLARQNFQAGRDYLARLRSIRCRFAGYAYIARFEWILRAIEHDGYCLRSEYPARKSLRAGLWMGWRTLASLFASPWRTTDTCHLAFQPVRAKDL